MTANLLDAESLGPLGGFPLVIHEAAPPDCPPGGAAIHLLVDRAGHVPQVDPAWFEVMVTVAPAAPAPWVSVDAARLDAQLGRVAANVRAAPHAAAMLTRVLRLNQRLGFDDALEVESLAYSVLLGGGEFARWLDRRQPGLVAATASTEPVLYERDEAFVTLTLASPETRNAMTAAMRDALFTALANVLEDPSAPALLLTAAGRCFSSGGDLAEFGTARDLAAAHAIRSIRSCPRLLHRIGERGQVHLHGACIGSGIELAAAAHRRTAATDLMVQLPELSMGLIPGAGGTVTLPRVIGRHRTAWLALGGFRIGARQALDWGLVHDVLA
jgi:hypothetical protein